MAKPEAEQEETNWSEAVEDLVEAGNTEAAISLLESTISKLEKIQQSQPTKESLNLQLASALTNLANLYSSNGFSLKSDHLLSCAFQIRYIHIKIHAPFSFFFPLISLCYYFFIWVPDFFYILFSVMQQQTLQRKTRRTLPKILPAIVPQLMVILFLFYFILNSFW